ncbi:hypothetical protein B0J17DRAFT_733890 [Rhizoctonia solani]|nr:hypothetical protein B0J17DRAFT_733890 [Rhizoctonia solani]
MRLPRAAIELFTGPRSPASPPSMWPGCAMGLAVCDEHNLCGEVELVATSYPTDTLDVPENSRPRPIWPRPGTFRTVLPVVVDELEDAIRLARVPTTAEITGSRVYAPTRSLQRSDGQRWDRATVECRNQGRKAVGCVGGEIEAIEIQRAHGKDPQPTKIQARSIPLETSQMVFSAALALYTIHQQSLGSSSAQDRIGDVRSDHVLYG